MSLDDLDKVASLLGAAIAIFGFCFSVLAYRLTDRRRRSPGQSVAGSRIGGSVGQVRGVGGNVRIGPTDTPVGEAESEAVVEDGFEVKNGDGPGKDSVG